MKKLLIVLLSAIAAVCGIFAISGCNGCNGCNIGNGNKTEHKHTLSAVAQRDATCTEDGAVAHFVCVGCGKRFEDSKGKTEIDGASVILPKGHKLSSVKANGATCTTDGNTAYYECAVCEKWFEDDKGKTEISDKSSVIIPQGHKLTAVEGHSATCTTDGNTAYYACAVCDKWFEDDKGESEISDKSGVVLPKGHKLSSVKAKSSTCTTDGNTAYYTCAVCDKWFEDEKGESEIADKSSVVLPKGHKLTFVEGNEATCIEFGSKAYYTCSGCDKWFEDVAGEKEITDKTSVVLPKNHKLTLVEGKEETCTEDGNKPYYTCSSCDKWFEYENSKSVIEDKSSVVLHGGHKLTPVEGREATCTEDGNLAYYICGVCDKWFEDMDGKTEITDGESIVVAAKGHNFKNNICEVCGAHGTTTNLKYTDRGDYIEVSGIGTATDTEIYIASEYKGKPVTAIGKSAFENCERLTSVSIPDGVTSIGEGAFSGCTSMTQLTVPDSVTYIGLNAFSDCESLKNVTMPAFVASLISKAELETVTITSGDTLSLATFSRSVNLTKLIIPDSLTAIRYPEIFDKKDSLDNCGKLKYNEYDNALYLGSEKNPYIVLVKSKGVNIASCTIAETTKFIYWSAFSSCNNITDMIIPESVISIGPRAFWSCYRLAGVAIGKGVNCIYSEAFTNCRNLTSLTIPDGVKSIGRNAFSGCYGLIQTENGLNYVGEWVIGFNGYMSQLTFRSNTKGIAEFTFADCGELERVTIPDSVQIIGESAFEYCENLTSVTIGKGVTSIGGHAFYQCSSLVSVSISGEVTSIGNNAFSRCGSLTTIYFDGTKEEWEKIEKAEYWYGDKGNFTVRCTDGDITR